MTQGRNWLFARSGDGGKRTPGSVDGGPRCICASFLLQHWKPARMASSAGKVRQASVQSAVMISFLRPVASSTLRNGAIGGLLSPVLTLSVECTIGNP